MYRKKQIVAYMSDGSICFTTGSYNLGYKSEERDYEMMATICEDEDDQLLTRKLEVTLGEDLSFSRRERVEDDPNYVEQQVLPVAYTVARTVASHTIGRNL